MPQLIAIDYGSKRTGIAVTDDLQLIASGLTTVSTTELIPFLKEYAQLNKIEAFVVGEPKRLHGEASDIEVEIKTFLEQLAKEFIGVQIHRIDERFTSKMAFDTMLKSGISKKKRRDKSLVDKISATLILQDFLNYR
ncbi:Holliday junction resolvase RuvX [Aquimarina agarilytica]|uniref:Holliday junction resolvase RuvX n=1 Tax=Aquimarina agarilytica TaxID=1087449 RepID=UPI000288F18E|nr:Holliday junction resolvase RuvX [Aquimarina agarilytica]